MRAAKLNVSLKHLAEQRDDWGQREGRKRGTEL